jgi:hypothetical protein
MVAQNAVLCERLATGHDAVDVTQAQIVCVSQALTRLAILSRMHNVKFGVSPVKIAREAFKAKRTPHVGKHRSARHS